MRFLLNILIFLNCTISLCQVDSNKYVADMFKVEVFYFPLNTFRYDDYLSTLKNYYYTSKLTIKKFSRLKYIENTSELFNNRVSSNNVNNSSTNNLRYIDFIANFILYTADTFQCVFFNDSTFIYNGNYYKNNSIYNTIKSIQLNENLIDQKGYEIELHYWTWGIKPFKEVFLNDFFKRENFLLKFKGKVLNLRRNQLIKLINSSNKISGNEERPMRLVAYMIFKDGCRLELFFAKNGNFLFNDEWYYNEELLNYFKGCFGETIR